jgi:hypothetical protein
MHLNDQLGKRVTASTYEQCVIVCAYVADGVSPEDAYLIRDMLNGLNTDGWWFINPGSFMVAFRSSNSGASRAQACEAAFARLSEQVPGLAHLGLGSAEGSVLCSLASAGYLDTPPLGNVVNEAAWKARANAS